MKRQFLFFVANVIIFSACTVDVTLYDRLPTLTTNSASDITATTATLGGNITDEGKPAYTERGVCLSSINQEPTIDDVKLSTDGTGTGKFNVFVINFTANTTYYARAYAINKAGTAYGDIISFTTLVATSQPVLTTASASNITATTATLGGNITNVGVPAYTERGVCYSTSQNPTTANNKTQVTGSGTGSFSANVSSLTANTTYYVRAYAINPQRTTYGTQVSFTTLAIMPVLTTAAAINITATTATLGGNITNAGTPAYTERGVCYSTSQNPTTANNKTPVTGSGTGSFIANVSGLAANTTYYVRAYAINSAGTAYGAAQVSFTTNNFPTLSEAWRDLLHTAMTSSPTQSLSNGKYKGQENDEGQRHGLGAYYWDLSGTKDFHFGAYNQGARSGIGIYIIGDFNDSRRMSNCSNSKIHVGNWIYSNTSGDGMINSVMSGTGRCYDKTGKLIYSGNFSNDAPTGTYPSTGNWDSYRFEVIKYTDDYYVGETYAGKNHGKGIYLWGSGQAAGYMWYGDWKDGTRDGYGILIYKDGTYDVGTWKGNDYTKSSVLSAQSAISTPLTGSSVAARESSDFDSDSRD